ncbi:hypothetical protein FRC17_010759 [Serendipita sp. 399]|nr:hypothetical protein FRC17_010759 [Serendipita sp. 399]
MSSLNPTRRQAPRPARPVQRHFAKKAPKDARDPDASSDEEEEAEQHHQQQHQYQQASHAGEETSIQQIGEYGKDEDEEEEEGGGMVVHRQGKKPAKPKAVRVALGNVEIKDGRVLVNGLEESGRTLVEQQMKQESSESESEEEEEEEEKEESSEEESSEEELPKPQLRPVFVSKQARSTLKERDAAAFDSEEAVKKREAAAEERKKQSRNMVGESIKKGMEEKEAKAPGAEIDDTDGLNPEEEFSAWRLRELMRLKREKEAERAREEERLEIERRRAMPEEQRLKEDLERAQKLRDEKPKGNGVFLQKYWHKGAFFQDTEELQMRDFSTKLESQVDVSLLPKLMQVKDFGKRSRTKYTHLKDQDTTIQNQPPKAGGSALPEGPPVRSIVRKMTLRNLKVAREQEQTKLMGSVLGNGAIQAIGLETTLLPGVMIGGIDRLRSDDAVEALDLVTMMTIDGSGTTERVILMMRGAVDPHLYDGDPVHPIVRIAIVRDHALLVTRTMIGISQIGVRSEDVLKSNERIDKYSYPFTPPFSHLYFVAAEK